MPWRPDTSLSLKLASAAASNDAKSPVMVSSVLKALDAYYGTTAGVVGTVVGSVGVVSDMSGVVGTNGGMFGA